MALVAVSTYDHLRSSNLNIAGQDSQLIREVVYGIDRWLDSMRIPGGYSGPVVHWWDDSLAYQGPGLDWRYEGIILGYLNLWMCTGDHCWLLKAQRAGDDLIAGQLPSGNFRNSRFELNPGTGGTPHEAACDLALLRLARALRDIGDDSWGIYKESACWNIQDFYLKCMWSSIDHVFYDDRGFSSFVPNKAATLVEALFEVARISEDDHWIHQYALPTIDAILNCQVRERSFDGAIDQCRNVDQKTGRYFPLYVARCVPALLEGYEWTRDNRFLGAACRAGEFLIRCRYEDGSFPQVIYSDSRINRYPQWVAGVGDILRVMDSLITHGLGYDRQPTLDILLAGRKPDGSICTAKGFGKVAPFGQQNDFRDELSVCGWVDKAFRYLSGLIKFFPSEVKSSSNKC